MNTKEIHKNMVKVLFAKFIKITEYNWPVSTVKSMGTQKKSPLLGQLIGYEQLANEIGFPGLKRHLGLYLLMLGEWCEDNGLPKLNALVVREGAETPGDGYPGGIEQWNKDLLDICNGRK